MVYLEMRLWALLLQGVLERTDPPMKASRYIRDLILKDLKHRNVLDQKTIDALLEDELEQLVA